MKSYFVHNGPVVLHVLENGESTATRPSLLVISGLWEPAERAIPLLTHLPGHVVAFSFRGRGLSSTPQAGYDLEDHLSDIAAVVAHCGLENYCVLGFSRGASYALGWSLQNQHQMKGLILVDQPPIHRSLSAEAVDFWSGLVYMQVPILNFMRREAIEGLGRDAREVDFTAQLSQLKLPVTLFAGRNPAAEIPSDISDETLDKYTRYLSSFHVVEFMHSGHMIPDEEQQKYIAEVGLCL
ncbi:alpha/beta fold hydrolase [Paenibacillus sp. HW567]|uniref:alpha/beta fold hydrolase n=1 Tax=Paenibacillus sp. HW567 TaxID=1034769 RepID=UPI00036A9F9F|nr:alpha/beta hydrolase [Paenibacillus sp. HW567]